MSKYIDNENNLTYIYLIKNKDIMTVNSLYNKNEINKYMYKKQEETYYIPKDVINIKNNKIN